MSAVVIPRFTMRCDECGAMITGIAKREEADWAAAEHDKALHPGPVAHESTAEKPVDPDCRYGKHAACPGWTWDINADTEAPCACTCHTPKEAQA